MAYQAGKRMHHQDFVISLHGEVHYFCQNKPAVAHAVTVIENVTFNLLQIHEIHIVVQMQGLQGVIHIFLHRAEDVFQLFAEQEGSGVFVCKPHVRHLAVYEVDAVIDETALTDFASVIIQKIFELKVADW